MYIINSQHKNIDTMQFIYWGLKPKCTSVHGVCRTVCSCSIGMFKMSWVQSVPAASPCYKATKQETCEKA